MIEKHVLGEGRGGEEEGKTMFSGVPRLVFFSAFGSHTRP